MKFLQQLFHLLALLVDDPRCESNDQNIESGHLLYVHSQVLNYIIFLLVLFI